MEDVTIEDEFDSNEDKSSNLQFKSNSLFSILIQIFNYQWIIFIFLLLISIYFYFKKFQKKNSINKRDDSYNEYDQMEKVRQRQQKQYEEQTLRYAQQKKDKMELLKNHIDEKNKPMKYRSNDHNPLTGQSNNGTNNSCSWRPSSSRRKAAGG